MVAWKIGPTWQQECVAAGIDGDGWGWNIMDGTFTFNDTVSQETRDAIAAVYAAHDPTQQTDPPTTPWPPGVPLNATNE
jgi:hypothetical protein